MNFEVTPERQMLKESLARFLRGSVTSKLLLEATENVKGHSSTLWNGLTEIGAAGALISEADGGYGGSGFDLLTVFQELGRFGVFEPLMETGILAAGLVAALGNDAQRSLLEEIVSGRIVVLAHVERDSRYDLSHVTTRAAMQGNGWLLTGAKSIVVGAPAADLALVTARIEGNPGDRGDIACFQVPLDAAGLVMRPYTLNGGGRAAELILQGVPVSDGQRFCSGDVLDALEFVHARAAAAQCAEAVGLMDAIKELTADYLRTRNQFGQPIGKFQALQHRMADLLVEIEQARSAAINICGHLESDRRERDRHVSAAKNLVGRVSRIVVEEAIQMHGAIGMTMEYALGHLAKRLMMVDHRFGDADWHLERFIRISASA